MAVGRVCLDRHRSEPRATGQTGDGEIVRTYDFETGRPDDDVVASASASDSGDPFTEVFLSHGSTTVRYDDSWSAAGSMSARFTFGGKGEPFSGLNWDIGTESEMYLRMIGRIDDVDGGVQAGCNDASWDSYGAVALDVPGPAYLIDNRLHTVDTGTMMFSPGDVFRLGVRVVAHPSDGVIEARVWKGAVLDSDPYEELSAVGIDTGSVFENAYFSVGIHTTEYVSVFLDELEVNDRGWPSFPGPDG